MKKESSWRRDRRVKIGKALDDLCTLRPNWALLADTDPVEFYEQVALEICALRAACREAMAKCPFPVGAQKAKRMMEEALSGLDEEGGLNDRQRT